MEPEPSTELTPEELRRLSERDPEALGHFFDVWFERVYAFIRRLVRDEHLSEDLTQDVFAHIYRAIETYDPSRALRPWVFTIATNKLRDHWRSRRHREAQTDTSLERDGAAEFVPAESAAPEAGLLRDERDAELRAAIDGLPEGMRVTLVLRVYDELSFDEIGRILDRNEIAVRKRYSRALEALRTTLGRSRNLHPEGAG